MVWACCAHHARRRRLDGRRRRSCSSALPFGTPWTVLGFWNCGDRPLAAALPQGPDGARWRPSRRPATCRRRSRIKTAIFMTLRNEDPARAILRLRIVKDSVDATGEGARVQLLRPVATPTSPTSPRPRRRRSRPGRRAIPTRRPHHLSPPHRQHRLQGRQRARLLRPLGQRLRADAAARRRQPDVGRRRSCGWCA